MALVTIGLPVFNGEKYLNQAILSLIKQDFSDWEMIISDNASTDMTKDICLHYSSIDRRIRYILQPENIGPVNNFGYVLNISNSKYFMWAACDDVWHPEFLKSCIERLGRNEKLAMAFSGIINIDSYERKIRDYPQLHLLSGVPSFKTIYNYLANPEIMGKANLIYSVYRTEFCKNIWAISPLSDVWGSDMCYNLAAIAKGSIDIDPRVLFKKRIVRDTDTVDRIDCISIEDPYKHIFPKSEFTSYFKALLHAVKGTPYYGLTFIVMLMRRARLDSILFKNKYRVKYLLHQRDSINIKSSIDNRNKFINIINIANCCVKRIVKSSIK